VLNTTSQSGDVLDVGAPHMLMGMVTSENAVSNILFKSVPLEPPLLVTANQDGTLKIWREVPPDSLRNEQGWLLLSQPRVPSTEISSVSFSPIDSTLIIGARDGNAYLWDYGQKGDDLPAAATVDQLVQIARSRFPRTVQAQE